MRRTKWIILVILIAVLMLNACGLFFIRGEVRTMGGLLQGVIGKQTLIDALPGTRNSLGLLEGLGNLDKNWLGWTGNGADSWQINVGDVWDSSGVQTNGDKSWLYLVSRDAFKYPTMSFTTSFPDLENQANNFYLKIGFSSRGVEAPSLQFAGNYETGKYVLSFKSGQHYDNHLSQCLPDDWRTHAYRWIIRMLPWGAEIYCDEHLVMRVHNIPGMDEGANLEQVSPWPSAYLRHTVWINGWAPYADGYWRAVIEIAYSDTAGHNLIVPLNPLNLTVMSGEGMLPKNYVLMQQSIPAGTTSALKECLPVAPLKDLGLQVRSSYPAGATAGGEVKIYTAPSGAPYYLGDIPGDDCVYWDTEPAEAARTLAFAADSQKAESWSPSLPAYSVAKMTIENKDADAGIVVCNCDAAWDSEQGADVVCSADTGDKKEGAASAKMVVGAGAAIGELASETIASLDISAKQVLVFWIKTSIEIERGQLQLVFYKAGGASYSYDILGEYQPSWDAYGNHTPEHLTEPFGLDNETWTKQVIDISDDASNFTDITKIAIKQTADLGAFTLHLDDLNALRAMKVLVKATLK